MEEFPKKFSKEVRLNTQEDYLGWEDIVDNEKKAQHDLTLFQEIMEEQGVDLKKSKVLEVDSGNSLFLKVLHKNGIDALGVDIRPRGDKTSKKIMARIEQLPFSDESFDVVTSSAVFDLTVYDQDQELMLKEIARVIKHGGFFFRKDAERNLVIPEELHQIKSNSIFNIKTIYKKL